MSLIAIAGLSRASYADAGTYCADYSSQAAKRKTGLSTVPASAAVGTANILSAGGSAPPRYPDTPEGKWQQAYDKAFAGCMQNYASDPVTATASTGPGAEPAEIGTEPKAEERPIKKIKAKARERPVKKARAKAEEPTAKKAIARVEEPPIKKARAKHRRVKRVSRAVKPIVKKQASYCETRPASDPGCKNKVNPTTTSISIKPAEEKNVPQSAH